MHLTDKKPINNGGPAFPLDLNVDGEHRWAHGMTLRDYFAAKAMQSILGSDRYGGVIGVNNYEKQTASNAYKIADAMLKAREEV